MDTVWIVDNLEAQYPDAGDILGVYSTEEAAKEAARKGLPYDNGYTGFGWEVTEMEVIGS